MPDALDYRIADAVNAATELFFQSLAQSFPNLPSGDVTPQHAAAFEAAATSAVRAYLASNA